MSQIKILFLLVVLVVTSFASGRTVTIGMLAIRHADTTAKQYEQTAKYLNSRLPSYEFRIAPLTYLDFDDAIKNKKINLVFTNPEHFIHLNARYSLTPLATIITLSQGHPVNKFGGVIFTRADNNKINYIEDLKAKKIATPTELSLGGFLTQKWELYKKDIRLENDCKLVFTGMPHDKVVTQVLSKRTDAGFVRTGILEALAKEGKLNLSDIKIVNRQPDNAFPEALSTELYPEWPIAATDATSNELIKELTKALIDISPTSKAAIEGGYYGFSPPSDYSQIESLMIKLGAIAGQKSFGIKDVLSKYYYYIISVLTVMLGIGFFVLFRLFISNRKLKYAASEIAKLSRHESNLLASLGEGVYGVDKNGICTFINDAALEMIGFEKHEVIGKNQHLLFHHKHFDGTSYHSTDCPIYLTLQDGKVRKINDFFITKDGLFLPVNLIATPIIENNSVVGAVVSFQDITTQSELLTELHEKEDRWHALFENNAAGILLVDSQRNLVDANIQLCRLFGYKKNELVGQNVSILHIDEEHYIAWTQKFQTVKDSSSSISHAEYPFKTKDGVIIWLTLSGVKLEIKHGSNGVVWSAIDITERKEAEDKLKRLNTSLESKIADEVTKNREKDMLLMKQSRLAAIGEMVSNIAHQWRQPLNALAIRIQEIPLAHVLGEIDDEFVSTYKYESMKLINYMSQTIEDFRNFFKPDKQKEAFSVLKSVEDAYSLTKDNLKLKSIHVGLFEYNDQFFAFGYKNEFAQVILNILSNAADALINKQEDDRAVMIDISRDGDFVKITICDNAGGIPDEIIDKIFDPYFTTKHKAQGTGLGLYMSKMIIEQNMDGEIYAYNTQRGACFEINVPTVND